MIVDLDDAVILDQSASGCIGVGQYRAPEVDMGTFSTENPLATSNSVG